MLKAIINTINTKILQKRHILLVNSTGLFHIESNDALRFYVYAVLAVHFSKTNKNKIGKVQSLID